MSYLLADEEYRAALWRVEQQQLLLARIGALRALSAPREPYLHVREAWRPVELAIAEHAASEASTPLEALEESDDRRNPFGCLIP